MMGKKSLQQSLFYACVVRDLLLARTWGWLWWLAALCGEHLRVVLCCVVSTILNICQSAALPNTLPQHTSLCSTTLGANRALRIIGWAENQAGRVELIRGAIIPLLSHQTNQLFNHQRVLQSCRGRNTSKLRKRNGTTIHVTPQNH